MFFSSHVLTRKGPLARVWIAAFEPKSLKRPDVQSTDIIRSVKEVVEPEQPIALRTSGHLLFGIVRIFSKKVEVLLSDANLSAELLHRHSHRLLGRLRDMAGGHAARGVAGRDASASDPTLMRTLGTKRQVAMSTEEEQHAADAENARMLSLLMTMDMRSLGEFPVHLGHPGGRDMLDDMFPALPAVAGQDAMEILRSQSQRAESLLSSQERFRSQISQLGFNDVRFGDVHAHEEEESVEMLRGAGASGRDSLGPHQLLALPDFLEDIAVGGSGEKGAVAGAAADESALSMVYVAPLPENDAAGDGGGGFGGGDDYGTSAARSEDLMLPELPEDALRLPVLDGEPAASGEDQPLQGLLPLEAHSKQSGPSAKRKTGVLRQKIDSVLVIPSEQIRRQLEDTSHIVRVAAAEIAGRFVHSLSVKRRRLEPSFSFQTLSTGRAGCVECAAWNGMLSLGGIKLPHPVSVSLSASDRERAEEESPGSVERLRRDRSAASPAAFGSPSVAPFGDLANDGDGGNGDGGFGGGDDYGPGEAVARSSLGAEDQAFAMIQVPELPEAGDSELSPRAVQATPTAILSPGKASRLRSGMLLQTWLGASAGPFSLDHLVKTHVPSAKQRRVMAARAFYDVLVLETVGAVQSCQEVPFGAVFIAKAEGFEQWAASLQVA